MAKSRKSALAAKGKAIMRLAKEIRKKHPHKKWQNCVKEAAKSCV
jgi:uncharacterized protein with HEPN domain